MIEHLDPSRLAAVEQNVFGSARPGTVVVTTPNAEYNVRWESLPGGEFRHPDHRFEWSRAQFATWAQRTCRHVWVLDPLSARGTRGRGCRTPDADGGVHAVRIELPDPSLVVLIGPSGSGKSSFARRHFAATEVISSDFCRGLVADDENDQSATEDAFAVLRFIAGRAAGAARFTVVDATNVQREARQPARRACKKHDLFAVAIVLDVPEAVCRERNRSRPDRDFGGHVVRRQRAQLHKSVKGLQREGFRRVHVLRSVEEVDAAEDHRAPLWTDRRSDHGPFDVIGDIHGCYAELTELMHQLGYEIGDDGTTVTRPGAGVRSSSATTVTGARTLRPCSSS